MDTQNWLVPVLLVFLCFSIIQSVSVATTGVNNLSCEYEEMSKFLQELAASYSRIARLVSIGTTEEDRDIWTMIISDSPHSRPLLRPQVKFVGNVNGMSGSACYVLLRLMKHLVEQYQVEASLERKLLESVEIHVIPNLNPDGYSRAVPGACFGKEGRLNANSVNLNTNFPDIFNDEEMEPVPMQKETVAMISWMQKNRFTLSVSLIAGVKVVEYPFAAVIEGDIAEELHKEGEPHFTPDDDIFKHLALTYTRRNGWTEEGWNCPQVRRYFSHGIVNGAEWTPQSGTMMDFNYLHGTFEITVGVSCCRNEANSTLLDELWWESREGLLHLINEVESGIRGQVLDAETYEAISNANLYKREYDYVTGDDYMFTLPWSTTHHGEFWRPWRPGFYKLRVEADGYKTKLIDVKVHSHQPTFIRVELEKLVTVSKEFSTTSTTTTTTTPTTTPLTRSYYSGGGEIGGQAENESIKKMTGFHHPDDFSAGKTDFARINDYNLTATTKATGIKETTEKENESGAQEKPMVQGSTKHFSSLTQLDNSFIHLFRGLDGFRSSSNDIKRHSVCKIITMCFLGVRLLLRQLAVNSA